MFGSRIIKRAAVCACASAALALPATAAATAGGIPAPGGGPPADPQHAVTPSGNPFAGEHHATGRAHTENAPAPPGDYPLVGDDKHKPLPPQANSKRGIGQSNSDTYSNDYLVYRGGWIQPAPHVYIIFWGDWSSAGDPYNVQNRLYYFLSGVGGSAWNKTATQYAYNCIVGTYSCPSTATHIGNPTGQLRAWWKDTSYVPAAPTDADVRNEALRGAAHFGDYSVNAQYVVAVPRGHDPWGFVTRPTSTSAWCAYHSQASNGAARVSYTNLPYMPDAGASRCGNGSAGSILDGVSIVEGHEYYESETDPFVDTGWDDSTHQAGEGGDKCASYVRKVAFSTGTFPVQAVWSNYDKYYSGSGCMYYQL